MLRRRRWEGSLDLLRPDQVAGPQTTANRSLGRTTASNAQSYTPLLPVTVYYSALFDLDGRPREPTLVHGWLSLLRASRRVVGRLCC
jgi:hypothetical protein